MKRFPLWLTVVPLLVAVAGYWWVWTGYKDDFRAEIVKVQPGAVVTVGGFPYRMEAQLPLPRFNARGAGSDIVLDATANSAVLNRGPWQRDLTIVRTILPRVTASIPSLPGASAVIRAPFAETSLHLDAKRRIARLSNVITDAEIDLALLGVPVAATKLEIHFRETPGRSAEAWSPTLPQRAQVVLSGYGVKAAGGAPLKLNGDLRVTGPARLVSYAAWAPKGTVEIHDLTLGDATGEVLRLNATLVVSEGRPRLTGTIVTDCPLNVRGALTGERVSEQRLRLPVMLTLSGSPGAWQLGGLPDTPRAVRAQQPPCPVLR